MFERIELLNAPNATDMLREIILPVSVLGAECHRKIEFTDIYPLFHLMGYDPEKGVFHANRSRRIRTFLQEVIGKSFRSEREGYLEVTPWPFWFGISLAFDVSEDWVQHLVPFLTFCFEGDAAFFYDTWNFASANDLFRHLKYEYIFPDFVREEPQF